MPEKTLGQQTSGKLNLPNQITLVRLVLSILLFVLIPLGFYLSGLVVFVIAAGTDWLDGYLARKHNLVTQLGRILDPFVDKFLICGSFVFLAVEPASGIAAWMAVVVVSRELLVTVIRSFLESEGVDFSANWAGKLKMVFQCGAVVASLLVLHLGTTASNWLNLSLVAVVWLAVASTVYSGVAYVVQAVRIIQQGK